VQHKKDEKNSCSKAEIVSEVFKHHWANGTAVLWGPECILDLKKKDETK